GLGNIAAGTGAGLEVIVNPADWVGDATIAAQVSRRQAQAGIDGAEALVGHHVLAGEQPGTTDIASAYRDLWQPAPFLPEADLEVDGLVFVILVAGDWAVSNAC